MVANGRWAFEKFLATAAAAIALVGLRHAFEEWVKEPSVGASGCGLGKNFEFNLTPSLSKESRCHAILLRIQYIEVEKRVLI